MNKSATERIYIRKRRLELGLSQVELARRANVSAAFICQFEKGICNIREGTARTIAAILSLPLDTVMGRESQETPAWLEILKARHNICQEEEDALLSVARDGAVYREDATCAALNNSQDEVEKWEKIYESIHPYIKPKSESESILASSEVKEIAKYLHVKIDEGLNGFLRAVDARIEKTISAAEDVVGFKEALLAQFGVWYERIEDDSDIDLLCNHLAERGLFRAVADCKIAFEKSGVYGGTYPVLRDGAGRQFLVIVDCRGAKAMRAEFTFWHELAHVIIDPRINLGTLAIDDGSAGDGRKSAREWLVDRIAGHLAFLPSLFKPMVAEKCKEFENIFCIELVDSLRQAFNPSASKQMTSFALLDNCDFPLVYLEAEIRSKRGSNIQELRLAVNYANESAKAAGIRFGKNMRVPTDSAIWNSYYGDSDKNVLMDEDLKNWTFSDGTDLGQRNVHICARRYDTEEGYTRVRAFVWD